MRWFLVFIASSALAQNSRDALQAAMEKQRAAAAIQRESVRKQRESTSQAPLLAESDCEVIGDSAVNPIIEAAAKAQELQAKLVRAVIQQESAFRPCAVSVKGAKGLMQLMPEIIEEFKVGDPFDAKESIDAGAQFLKQLMDRYKGDLSLTLGAYNAGPTAVDEAKGVPNIPKPAATWKLSYRPWARPRRTSQPLYNQRPLYKLTRRVSRRPSPLKIEAAQVAGDVQHFADEIESWGFPGLEGLRGKLLGIHAADGDFGFFIALGAVRRDSPTVEILRDRLDFTVA
jgi:hypothetical protein